MIMSTDHLQFNYEELSLLLENPYEGIIFIDTEGIVRFVNLSFAKYNRSKQEKMIGLSFESLKFDSKLLQILSTKEYTPFQIFENNNRHFIVSRFPVFDRENHFIGACARYFSINPKDTSTKFGADYSDLIEKLQINAIRSEYERSIMELNSYKEYYNRKHQPKEGINKIIGSSPAISHLKSNILRIGDSPSTVLITGESGTGKELVAKAIHFHGDRVNKPFIKVNCTAIPDTLIESELFGYTDGAFTGAKKGGKMGKFEMANGGTIFLDEIGDMPLTMQAKILRVLQEREIERVGGSKSMPIDVRVIAATNRRLDEMVRDGEFREDLFYRINIINLHLPPLRKRKEDIPEIANNFIQNMNEKMHKNIHGIEKETLEIMLKYDWPGNIRELVNSIESAMNFCQSNYLEYDDFGVFLPMNKRIEKKHVDKLGDMETNVNIATKAHLESVLAKCGGSRKEAASYLNVSKSTLYRMMKKYNMLDQ